MKISVVTVCLNSEKTIGRTLESFLQQSYADKEMIIVDGASSDRTLKIARSFAHDSIRIVSEKDGGIYYAMNRGLQLYKGDAVGFLGSDDTFHDKGSLELLAEGLGTADVVYGDLYVVRDQIDKRVLRTYRPGPYYNRAFQRGWFPPHPTFYVRRHVVDSVGLFDTRYKIGADYDFVLRTMAKYDFRSRYLPHILIDFQIGGVSSRGFFRSILRHNVEALTARRRQLGSSLIDAAFFMKPARSFLQINWR